MPEWQQSGKGTVKVRRKRGDRRGRWSWGLRLGLLAGAAAALLVALGFTEELEMLSRDLRFRLRGTRDPGDEIVLVTIDQRALDELGRYPWEREVLAEVVEALREADPACLALDLALLETSDPEADRRLARALGGVDCVLPAYLSPLPLSFAVERPETGSGPLYWYAPAPAFRRAAHTLGHVALDPDVDGVYRTLYLEQSYGGTAYPAFAAAAAACYRGDELEPHSVGLSSGIGQERRLLIDYRGPAGTFPRLSAADALELPPAELARRLAGKLVFVGASAEGLHDSVSTPFSATAPMPAVEVHANATLTLLEDSEPTVWPRWIVLLFIIAAAGMVAVLYVSSRPGPSALWLLGLLFGWALLSWAAFVLLDHLLPVVPVLTALALSFVFTSLGRLVSVNRTLDRQLLNLGRELRSDRLSPAEPTTLTKEAQTSLTYTLGLLGLRVTRADGRVLHASGEGCRDCRGEPEEPLRVYRDYGDGLEICLCYSGTPSVNEAALLAAASAQLKSLFAEQAPTEGPFASLSSEHTQAKLEILSRIGETLAANRATLQRVLSATAKGVLLINSFGLIRLANAAAGELFSGSIRLEGGEDDEDDGTGGALVGQSVYSLLPGRNLRELIVDAVDGSTSQTVKLHGHTYLLEVSPLADERGLRGFVVTLTDITDLARIDRMKTEVMHIISHDLKGPLGTIRGFAELLTDEELSDEERLQYGGYIVGESDKLLQLIEAFLDVSRIESGRIKGEFLPADLGEVAAEAVKQTGSIAERKQVELILRRPRRLSPVSLDVNLVSRALANLIDNAVKFSPVGSVVVIEVHEKRRVVEVQVTDLGPGISPGEQKRIFAKFYRAKNAKDVPGTGMGLAFVAQVARLHSAEIVVNSTPGSGATFTLRFAKPGAEADE